MSTNIKCYLLEPVDKFRRWLRRYSSGNPCPNMPGEYSYHNAQYYLDEYTGGKAEVFYATSTDRFPRDDQRWPSKCGCGYKFTDQDEWQVFHRSLWKRSDTGEQTSIEEAPPGAIWDATWFHDSPSWCGPDGRSLVVKLPGGHDWHIDSRASNCTLKDDSVHKCWVRHGVPPNITVDKDGHTCAAGGGSILLEDWHGFLRGGELVQC